MDDFSFARVELARKRRGLTKGQLAGQAELSPRTLNMYEKSEIAPTPQTLDRLAGVLDFPPEFFCRPEADEPTEGAVSFRARTAMSMKQRNQALSAAAIAME